MKFEHKSFELEVKSIQEDASGKTATIRGYASTFGNVDLGGDIVQKGAFKKTLKETGGKIPILADHNPSKQIGWNLRAEEDDKGLNVEGELELEVPEARAKWALAKKAIEIGAKMGLSIGYFTIKAEPQKDNPRVRELKELKLFEYSLVTFPMNTDAMVTAAKHFGNPTSVAELAHSIRIKAQELGIPMKLVVEEALRLNEAATLDETDPALLESQSQVLASLQRLKGLMI